MRRILFIAFVLLTVSVAGRAQAPRRVPTVEDLLSLKTLGATRISPDGGRVAYTVTQADLKQDAFVTQIWLVEAATGKAAQLTRGLKSATNPKWSPDGTWLAFTSDRIENKNQVFAIRPDGGEAVQLTKSETAVTDFDWSPDGATIAYLAAEAPTTKERKEHLGDYEVVRREYGHAHIWTFKVDEALAAPVVGRQRTKGKGFSVGDFSWSPDGGTIAFAATVNPDLIQGATADLYLLSLGDDAVKSLVAQPGPDGDPTWSPDGNRIVFSSAMGKADFYARNLKLAVVPVAGGAPRPIADAFDEIPNLIEWNRSGILFSGAQKTASHLFRADPDSGKFERISAPDALMANGFSLSRDGRRVVYAAGSPTSLAEIYVTDLKPFSPRVLTNMSAQVAGWTLGTREVVSWKSRDGAIVEGVLIKPADFDPTKKYPLLCVIHGGPTGIDRPALLSGGDASYYPVDLWVGRGALVLKVNYRGSAGYGETFRRLNYRNLGVGDAWDVLSGVDFLIGKGWIDPKKVGCMGWSQGGYISAFLTTSSDRFAAISVGAGISNWATYYYNTDITPFTINYLGDDPADDPEVYRVTSPMSYIKQAKTPTLIQHGELDRRVPIANAYELRQGLEDRNVPVEMVVYKGFGHGITKPKSRRAVLSHNLAWFNHYIFGDAPPNFVTPDVPKENRP